MTKNEKQLLIKDLSARLPYGVICKGINLDLDVTKDEDEYVNREVSGPLTKIGYDHCTLGITKECELSTIRSYLRPMSSMTDEEYKEYRKAGEGDTLDSAKALRLKAEGKCYISSWYRGADWLNAHHFDYRGLIGKGLALEAPKDMYN